MRKLRLVVLTRSGAIPVVIAAAVLPAAVADCGARTGLAEPALADAGLDAAGGVGGQTGGSGGFGGGIVLGGYGGTGGGAGQPFCPNGVEETYTVPLPPEGTPADPGQICAATVEPVESGLAARVTLQKLGNTAELSAASGLCVIDPALESRVVGAPVIEVIDATDPRLLQMQVSNLQKQAGGWSFQASFPGPLFISPNSGYTNEAMGRMTVRITLELDCSPQPVTRIVHAATDIHVCVDGDQVVWVSSGDSCTVCGVIAEMAPSPIVPDRNPDDLPLAQALRLRLVELARIADTLVLLAEHDGGEGLEYEWHASAGRVERLAADIVVWTLEDGMQAPFIQAAVHGPGTLAVASYGFNEAA